MASSAVGIAFGLTAIGGVALVAANVGHPVIYLFTEIVVGAIAYVIGALVLCRATSKDLLGLLKQALKRG
jgi:hypothetical protein